MKQKMTQLLDDPVLAPAIRLRYLNQVSRELTNSPTTSVYEVMKEVALQAHYQCRPEARLDPEEIAAFGSTATAISLRKLFQLMDHDGVKEWEEFLHDKEFHVFKTGPPPPGMPNLLQSLWDHSAPVIVTLTKLGGESGHEDTDASRAGRPIWRVEGHQVWLLPQWFAGFTDVDEEILARGLSPEETYKDGLIQFRLPLDPVLEAYKPTVLDGMPNPKWTLNSDRDSPFGELNRPEGWTRGIPEIIIRNAPRELLIGNDDMVEGKGWPQQRS